MTFDEIPIRMMQLGVNRAWLAEQCDYSLGSLARILAPNGDVKAKNDKALRRIWEALDREEERQSTVASAPVGAPFRVSMDLDKDRFDRWMAAAYRVPGRSFEEWATNGLEEIAAKELPFLYKAQARPSSRVAANETAYRVEPKK